MQVAAAAILSPPYFPDCFSGQFDPHNNVQLSNPNPPDRTSPIRSLLPVISPSKSNSFQTEKDTSPGGVLFKQKISEVSVIKNPSKSGTKSDDYQLPSFSDVMSDCDDAHSSWKSLKDTSAQHDVITISRNTMNNKYGLTTTGYSDNVNGYSRYTGNKTMHAHDDAPLYANTQNNLNHKDILSPNINFSQQSFCNLNSLQNGLSSYNLMAGGRVENNVNGFVRKSELMFQSLIPKAELDQLDQLDPPKSENVFNCISPISDVSYGDTNPMAAMMKRFSLPNSGNPYFNPSNRKEALEFNDSEFRMESPFKHQPVALSPIRNLFSTTSDRNATSEVAGEKYFCHICTFVGSSDADFSAHMKSHFEHQCPYCSYSSRTEGRLKRHVSDFHSDKLPDQSTPKKVLPTKKKKVPTATLR